MHLLWKKSSSFGFMAKPRLAVGFPLALFPLGPHCHPPLVGIGHSTLCPLKPPFLPLVRVALESSPLTYLLSVTSGSRFSSDPKITSGTKHKAKPTIEYALLCIEECNLGKYESRSLLTRHLELTSVGCLYCLSLRVY